MSKIELTNHSERFIIDLREAIAMRDKLPVGPRRSRMTATIMHSAAGVLRFSKVEEDLELARAAIHELTLIRYMKRVSKTAQDLNRHGAHIPDEAIEGVAQEAARRASNQTIAEALAGRLRTRVPA